jgi:hypothetical protein
MMQRAHDVRGAACHRMWLTPRDGLPGLRGAAGVARGCPALDTPCTPFQCGSTVRYLSGART